MQLLRAISIILTLVVCTKTAFAVNCLSENCLTLHYVENAGQLSSIEAVVKQKLQAAESLVDVSKFGPVAMAYSNYNVYPDTGNGTWVVDGYATYELKDKLSKEAFMAVLQANGIEVEALQPSEICSH
ncbi:MAG: hypothetical protein AB7L92_01510 [Alphaproteobacteria bacterium]